MLNNLKHKFMILDFTDIINKTKHEKHIEFSIENVEDVVFDGDNIIFEGPVKVNGTASIVDDIISLNVNVKANLKLTCSRCLETYMHLVDIDMHEKFTNNRSIEDEEIIPLDSGKIDITEIVVDNILSALPIKKLCSENCKGLCQHCGTNLNRSTCDCDKDDIDLRMLKLKDLFGN